MLYWLSELSDTIGILDVFRYITFRPGGAMFTGMVFVLLFGPRMIASLRLKQGEGRSICPDGPRLHLLAEEGTPTVGGLMIVSSLVVATVLWANPGNPYVWIVLGVTLGFGLIGLYDDYLKVTDQTHAGFSVRTRLPFEFAIAAVACFLIALVGLKARGWTDPTSTSLAFSLSKSPMIDFSWFFVAFAAIVVVGAGNAVNMTDALDGLAIVLVMIAAACFGAISWVIGNAVFAAHLQLPYVPGAGELAVLCGAILGAGIVLLWLNAPPASIFMATPAGWRSAACSALSPSSPSMRSCSASSACFCSCKRRPGEVLGGLDALGQLEHVNAASRSPGFTRRRR